LKLTALRCFLVMSKASQPQTFFAKPIKLKGGMVNGSNDIDLVRATTEAHWTQFSTACLMA
jgi:hypothetical protein